MPVFNLCLKIIKKNIPSIMIYLGVFVMVSIIMMVMTEPNQQNIFAEIKTNIVFIAEDESPLVDGLRKELAEIVNFVEIEDEPEVLQDALFFRKVHYILRVPEGFTKDFVSGGTLLLEKTVIPDSTQTIRIDMMIDRYLNIARMYIDTIPEIDLKTVVAHTSEDLSRSAGIKFGTDKINEGEPSLMVYYFNFLAYTFMFVVIIGVSAIMIVLNNIDIRRRNACAPISATRFNVEYYLVHIVFMSVSWLILVAFCLLFGYNEIGNPSTLYYVVNSLVFALSASGLSFLIGNLVNGRETINAVANILVLSSSFISGVFVPQALLGENVLRIASFMPAYWYVKANNKISELMVFDWQNLSEIFTYALIQLGFALAFFIIALVVGKRKFNIETR